MSNQRDHTKPFDQAFKFLAEDDPESLLLLLGVIEAGDEATIELLPREVGMASLFPDQPYLLTRNAEQRIIHVEAQTVWPANMPERTAEYGVLLWLKHRDLPIDSYVLLLTSTGLPSDVPTEGVISIGDLRITKGFHLIRLWEFSAAEALAAQREALLPFVPLMQGGKAELELSSQRLTQVQNEPRRNEMARHFLMLGGLRYNRFELLELIGRTGMIPLEQLRTSDFYQYILDEGRDEGRAEVREEALESVADVFRLYAGSRFPDLELGPEVEAVGEVKMLRQLCHEMDQFADAAALQARLRALAAARKN